MPISQFHLLNPEFLFHVVCPNLLQMTKMSKYHILHDLFCLCEILKFYTSTADYEDWGWTAFPL